MKRFILLAVVFFYASLSAGAQAPATSSQEQVVLKLEAQWVDALVKADTTFLETLCGGRTGVPAWKY